MTGVEALYADLSHFGRQPIVIAWYVAVLPALLVCYLGESATVLADPHALDAPFYALTPGPWLWPSILLSTAATVIASQALISGAYTLIEQAISLGLTPRMQVLHTSTNLRGQVYIPAVNIALAVGCIALVAAFKSSDRLASAFGLAVSCTMLATSIAWYIVVTKKGTIPKWQAIPALIIFCLVDGSFVIAGLPKFMDGGWVPFLVSTILTILAFTWVDGRRRLVESVSAAQTPLNEVIAHLESLGEHEDRQTVVLLTPDALGVPFAGSHPWMRKNLDTMHIVLLKVQELHVPYVPTSQRVEIEYPNPHLTILHANIGYMEPPRLKSIIAAAKNQGLDISGNDIIFAASTPEIQYPKRVNLFAKIKRGLFSILLRNARHLSDDLELPANQRVGLSTALTL